MKSIFRLLLLSLIFWPVSLVVPDQGQTATYYVRTDGGSPDLCTGLVNSPFPGSGDSQPCAWDHPFRALPPSGAARIIGGDTVIIGPGSYRMGFGSPGAENCSSDSSWDCALTAIPSGPNTSNPTRILGAGWDSGCSSPPELWGTERANWIVNLTQSQNVEISCLEITDHSGCVEGHADPAFRCQRDSYPYGDWAAVGLYAEDSSNVVLKNLNIHGLAHTGIWAGRLSNWTLEKVRLVANGLVGWDGDIGENVSSNSGILTFRQWTVAWNGCAETYPGRQPAACWNQEAGGYGDGIGTGTTGGHWIIEDSVIQYNTQDGLDLLYAREPGSQIDIRRTLARGNAGNQIKTSGPVTIENSIIVGNCGFFEGKPFTYHSDTEFDHCRAGGDALVFNPRPGEAVQVINSTITGQGTCLAIAGCALNQTCNGSERVFFTNNIFVGQSRFLDPSQESCFAWFNDESPDGLLPSDPFRTEYTIINGTGFGNVDPCGGTQVHCYTDPGLVNSSIQSFSAYLAPGSPAIDAGLNNVCPATDYLKNPRPKDAVCDLGAYEGVYVFKMTYLPLILKN
jgi:hypothetical protein